MATPRQKRRKTREPAGLEDSILEKYARFGISVLADRVPKRLDPVLRKEMETIIGVDLPEVRIHVGEGAAKISEALGARAFAVGKTDIFFAKEEFSPQTAKGKALLAHELAHIADRKTGLSRKKRKPDIEEAEATARQVEEMVLAREEVPLAEQEQEMLEPADIVLPPSTEPESAGREVFSVVDKTQLEEKIIEFVEREAKRERERRGLF